MVAVGQVGNQGGVVSWKPREEGIQERSSVACWVRAAEDVEAKAAAGFGAASPSWTSTGSVVSGGDNHLKLCASFADMVE